MANHRTKYPWHEVQAPGDSFVVSPPDAARVRAARHEHDKRTGKRTAVRQLADGSREVVRIS